MHFLYNLLLYLLSPLWMLWAWRKTVRRNGQAGWRERMGFLEPAPRTKNKRIWIHAVSVGEVMVVSPIIAQIKKLEPDVEIFLSVITMTGHETAVKTLGDKVERVFFLPLDLIGACRRALSAVQPDVVAIAETEIWLNFISTAKKQGAQVIVVNGRISDRSFNAAVKIKGYYRTALGKLDAFFAQTETDADRAIALGAAPDKVVVGGNTKFDQALDGLNADPEYWRRELNLPQTAPVIVVGSTRTPEGDEPYEERIIISAYQKILNDFPDACMVLAPRHIERADEIEALFQSRGFNPQRRSNKTKLEEPAQVVLLDTLGELANVYCIADVAVVGGSFIPLGGQNILQPIGHGKPVIHGPYMDNFRDIADMADKAEVAFCAQNADEIYYLLLRLLNSLEERIDISRRANNIISTNAGAAKKCADAIIALCNR